jgi:hypothetical protein
MDSIRRQGKAKNMKKGDEAFLENSIPLENITRISCSTDHDRIYSLGKVASTRIKIIYRLEQLLKDGTTERPLQKLLEKAPWLVSPEWTPISSDRSLETFRKTFEIWYERKYSKSICTTAIKNERKEPDFIFVKDDSQVIIVEIKKPDYALSDQEYKRAFDYLDAVRCFLKSQAKLRESFRAPQLIIVCDKLSLNQVNISSFKHDPDVKHIPWHTLLERTLRVHHEFLTVPD